MFDVPVAMEVPTVNPKPKKFVLAFKPNTLLSTSKQMLDDSSKRDGSESPQNNDDFLTIIPKPTLLSKERAKKRLQAFSSQKLSSPVAIKKPVVKKAVEVKEEKFNPSVHSLTSEENSALGKPLINIEHVSYDLKGKDIIHHIEPPKNEKQQNDKFDAPVQVQRYPSHSQTQKHRRVKRRKYHGRPTERKNPSRYPMSWDDFRDGHYCLLDIQKMNNELVEKSTKDFVKTMNFEAPNMILRNYKYKQISGKRKGVVPPQFLRFTVAPPRVSYNVNFKRMSQQPAFFYTLKQVQEVMPKRQRESIKSFIRRLGDARESSHHHHNHHHHSSSAQQPRQWFTKEVLPNLVKVEDNSKRDDDFNHYRSKKSEERNNRHYKQHKYEEVGKRHEESFANLEEVKVETAVAYEMHYHNDFHNSYVKEARPEVMNFYNSKYKEDVGSFKTKEGVHHFANSPEIEEEEENNGSNTEMTVDDYIDSIALPPEKSAASDAATSEKLVSSSTSELCKDEEEISLPIADGKEQIHEVESSKTEQVKENSNGDEPNTDEYRSHWESEGEGEPEMMVQSNKANNCWESDEEDKVFPPPRYECIPRTKDVTERSLEMPLNINLSRSKPLQKKFNLFEDIETKSGLFMDEAWEKPKARAADLEYEAIEKERRTLNEERKKLEIEKQKIAEMERRLLQGELYINQLDDGKDEFRGVVTKSNASYTNKKLKLSRWEMAPSKIEEAAKGKEDLLEDEYEQFIKAVSVDEPVVSSSDNSSDASDDSSSESSAENTPVPVASPPSVTSTNANSTDTSGIDLDNRKPLTSIVLNRKTNLLDRSVFKESEDEEEREDDADMEEKESSPKRRKVSASPSRGAEEKVSTKAPKRSETVKKKEQHSPHHRHSPMSRRDHSPRRREYSPKRRMHSPVRGSKRSRYSPSRYSPPSSRKRRDLSPRRKHTPSRRRHSPPSRSRRDPSPPPYRRRYSRSTSKEPPKTETIQRTLQRLAGMDQYEPVSKSSPVNSPLDGFKRSLADSTISDEQLLQNQEQPYMEQQQQYYEPVKTEPGMIGSPKRIPLDDRINLVLGIDEKDEHKPITTTYTTRQHYDSYNYYNYDHFNSVDYEQKAYEHQNLRYMTPKNLDPTTKVLQIGNVLQVVPTDNSLPPQMMHKHQHHQVQQQQQQPPPQKEVKTAQRILQVGNMLQIVPTTTEVPHPIETPRETVLAAVAPASLPPPMVQHKQSAEDLMQLKIAERKAEREKRRLDREKRRKEKERKRIEREKRKQLKIKQKTEEMIKKALSIETPMPLDDEEEPQMQWPPVSSLLATSSSSSKTTGKGILIRGKETEEYSERPKKGVKFADGIIPGEGTSPSGGEELSSPPPMVERSKEKRFTKTKKPKIRHPKKKIKVQIVRKRKHESDEEDEDGLPLPPPSPPPGSPPPHLFPPRIKPTPNFSVLPPMGIIFNSQQPPPMPEALQPQNYPPTLSSPLIRQQPKQLNHSIKTVLSLPLQVQPTGLSSSHR